MAHQVRFERDRDDGGWSLYLEGRDAAIGHIRPTPNGRWHGLMVLDGQRASFTHDDRQMLVDRFQSWAVTGIPSQAEMQALSMEESRAWVRQTFADSSQD